MIEASSLSKLRYSVTNEKASYLQRQILPIMIRKLFTQKFNNFIWQQISFLSPKLFLQQQKDIKQQLFQNIKYFERYFETFYQNHIHIYHWAILARQKQSQIKQYIFEQLIKVPFGQHIQQYKLIHANKKIHTFYMPLVLKSKNNNSIYQQDKKQPESQKSDKKPKFAYVKRKLKNNTDHQLKLSQKTYKYDDSHKQQMLNSIFNKAFSQIQKNKFDKFSIYFGKNQNYHDLYVKTYAACDGPKYIVYDYQKHMKGYLQRTRYNKYIRNSKQSSFYKNTIRKSREDKQNFDQKWPHVQSASIFKSLNKKQSGEYEMQEQKQQKLNSSFEYITYGQTKTSFFDKKNNEDLCKRHHKGLSKFVNNKSFKINKYPFCLKNHFFKNRG